LWINWRLWVDIAGFYMAIVRIYSSIEFIWINDIVDAVVVFVLVLNFFDIDDYQYLAIWLDAP
jgi:putative effector of murein hydrolase